MNNVNPPNTASSLPEDVITTSTKVSDTDDIHNRSDYPDTSSQQTSIQTAYDTLLQTWLTEASELRKLQNSAKTQAKRDFYGKKFKKLSKQIVAMVASRGFVSEYVKATKKKEIENVVDATQ